VVRSKEKRREEKERVGGQIQREGKRGKGHVVPSSYVDVPNSY
jgi:hypothetical protein